MAGALGGGQSRRDRRRRETASNHHAQRDGDVMHTYDQCRVVQEVSVSPRRSCAVVRRRRHRRVEASSWEPAARGGPRIARGGEILAAALIFKVVGPAGSPGDWANPCVSACPDQSKTGRRFLRWCRSIYRSQNSNLETRGNILWPFPPAHAPVRCIVLFIAQVRRHVERDLVHGTGA